MRLIIYSNKHVHDNQHDNTHNSSFTIPNEEVASDLMNNPHFCKYVHIHGNHFTEALADKASSMMINYNNTQHKWTSDQIKQQLLIHDINDFGNCTLGDITYLSNMAYADFYPKVLDSEYACIKYAMAVAKDPDGYNGIVFSRWIADIIGKNVTTINWEKYV